MPYLYNTWCFYLIISLLIPAAGFIVFKLKVLQLEKTNLQINQLLLSKIAEFENNTQRLKALEKAVQSHGQQPVKEDRWEDDQLLAILLHDIRSPLRFLSTISKAVVKDFEIGSTEENHEHLIKLHQSVGALRSFVEESYFWVRNNDKGIHLSIKRIRLQEVFNKMETFYGEFLSYNENQLIIAPTTLTWETDQHVLCLIVRNLLDNANKYTQGGKVYLSCYISRERLCIQVKDSGQGLNERQIQAILQPCQQPEGAGMGSLVIARMLKKINGRLTVTSTLGKGSIFTIELAPVAMEVEFSPVASWSLLPDYKQKYLVGELV